MKEIALKATNEGFALLPKSFDSREARVMEYAIGLQESRFKHRQQIGGPARGFWQFERGGGVAGVLRHNSSAFHAAQACRSVGVVPEASSVYAVLAREDMDGLAAAFARLLLWTDPKPLPRIGDVDAAWDYYIRNWRPGKPHRQTWDALYAEAASWIG